jgi:signal transduction histidine kinase
MDRYEAILAVYQAQNAIGIARVAEADKYAASALAKAERSLAEAQRLQARKANTRLVVQNAHEAAQTAEDARVISEQRKRDEELSALRNRTEARPGSAPATSRREPQTTSGPESTAHK